MARRGENIYKRKDGRYEGRYVIGRQENGRTKFGYVYGRQYTTVRNTLLQKKAELFTNTGTGKPCGPTVMEWMQRWLTGDVRWRVKESTFQTYQRLVNQHIAPSIGGVPLDRLSPDDVRGMVNALYAKELAHSTVRSVLRLAAAAMQAAAEDGLICHNPCHKLRLRPAHTPEQRALTRDEQQRLRHALTDAAHLPALLSLYTGMRLGEICALKWQDVDWEKRTLTVRRTVQRLYQADRGKTELLVGTPKTQRSQRVIPIPEFLMEELHRLHTDSRGDYLFGRADQAAEPRTVQRRFASVVRGLGMQGVHFHTLRHTFATRLLELSVDVKTVSILLGHSTARTTLDLYAHSFIDQQRDAVRRLCAL